MAGFEPASPCRPLPFQDSAFSRSATFPFMIFGRRLGILGHCRASTYLSGQLRREPQRSPLDTPNLRITAPLRYPTMSNSPSGSQLRIWMWRGLEFRRDDPGNPRLFTSPAVTGRRRPRCQDFKRAASSRNKRMRSSAAQRRQTSAWKCGRHIWRPSCSLQIRWRVSLNSKSSALWHHGHHDNARECRRRHIRHLTDSCQLRFAKNYNSDHPPFGSSSGLALFGARSAVEKAGFSCAAFCSAMVQGCFR